MRFAPDGRIFVAEKAGRIQVFDDFGDPTPTLYADLSRQVHDFWDRGLLGMELDPGFRPGGRMYVLYAYDKDPNSAAFPRWGDECPSPPGAMEDGCVVTGRLSRLSGGFEQVLIEDWCQQYSSHSRSDRWRSAPTVRCTSARVRVRTTTSPTGGRTGFRAIRAETRRRWSVAPRRRPARRVVP